MRQAAPDSLGIDDTGPLRRRWEGTHEVDPWGLDPDLVQAVSPLGGLRFRIAVEHPEHLPAAGPALIVANQRVGLSEPFVLARGIRLATGRFVRMAGVPDALPAGPLLRRLGGVLARPDEVAGLLRAGQVVGVLLDRDVRHRRGPGRVPARLLEPAFDLGAPVVPAALLGRELGRRWRVRVGRPVPRPSERGPLAAAELADRVRAEVGSLLDERRGAGSDG